MKILLSAFACRPNHGSEPGVGWNFAVELAKTHQVYVLTRSSNQQYIEQYKEYEKLSKNITFLYYDIPIWNRFKNPDSFLMHIYYFFWQVGVFNKAKKWICAYKVDLIHHITYGVFRTPSLLAFLDRPFIFGPIGGGESYPIRLTKNLRRPHVLTDLLRNTINFLSISNPLLLLCFRHSTLIVCKTKETMMKIPSRYHDRCIVSMEIGLRNIPKLSDSPKIDGKGLKLLFVGRLVYWKGPHLVLKAFAKLVRECSDCCLSIIGSGSDKTWLMEMAEKLGINSKISWIERVEQQQLFRMYQEYDFMLFPSLRDSSGNVVMEALAHQLPVLCLDLGGPCHIIDNQCGIVISTKRHDEEKIVEDIFTAIQDFYYDRTKLSKIKAKTQPRAKHFLIEKVVNQIYKHPILQVHINYN